MPFFPWATIGSSAMFLKSHDISNLLDRQVRSVKGSNEIQVDAIRKLKILVDDILSQLDTNSMMRNLLQLPEKGENFNAQV